MGNVGRRDVYLLQAQPLKTSCKKLSILGTSLVVQWLRICLAMQRMRVWSLVGELRPHMPQFHPCAATTEPACSGARMSQLWNHVLHSERSHVMPSYRASRGGFLALTDSVATRKWTSVPGRARGVTHRPDQPSGPAWWEGKKLSRGPEMRNSGARGQDRVGLLQDKGSHSGCWWRDVPGWEARSELILTEPRPGGGSRDRQTLITQTSGPDSSTVLSLHN